MHANSLEQYPKHSELYINISCYCFKIGWEDYFVSGLARFQQLRHISWEGR